MFLDVWIISRSSRCGCVTNSIAGTHTSTVGPKTRARITQTLGSFGSVFCLWTEDRCRTTSVTDVVRHLWGSLLQRTPWLVHCIVANLHDQWLYVFLC